jgi:DNA-binding NarL/FixJ family response regulator
MQETAEDKRLCLVLVGDQALFLATLGKFLAAQPDFEVIAQCGTAAEALEALSSSPVGIVLLDSDFRGARGVDLIAASRRNGYQGRFLMVHEAVGATELADAIKLGASGVFLKSEAPDRLVQAIRLVASGAVWVDQKAIQVLADQLADRPRLAGGGAWSLLTEREEKVLFPKAP